MKVQGIVLYLFYIFCFTSVFLGIPDSVQGRLLSLNKPDPKNAAASARWLVSQNSWAVLSTISIDMEGAPFGNVVSFSDGPPNEGSGVPYFYITTLDPTARDAEKDPRASLAISEYAIGTCGKNDPENPICARITLTGKLKLVDRDSKEEEFARIAMFSKHSQMKYWPEGHHFKFYKLEIEDIFFINWIGGARTLTPDDYLGYNSYKMNAPAMDMVM